MAEIGTPITHRLEGLQDLVRRGVLQDVASGTHLKCPADDHRIAVHGENEHRRLLIVSAQPANESEPPKSARSHGKIDDNHVGLLGAVKAKSLDQSLRLRDLVDARVLQELAAALQDDGMVVDDEDARHDTPPASSRLLARLFVPRWTGIATRMTVPFEGALSMTHVPPSERALSVMVVRPKPLGAD